jgi:hypothetical protein
MHVAVFRQKGIRHALCAFVHENSRHPSLTQHIHAPPTHRKVGDLHPALPACVKCLRKHIESRLASNWLERTTEFVASKIVTVFLSNSAAWEAKYNRHTHNSPQIKSVCIVVVACPIIVMRDEDINR